MILYVIIAFVAILTGMAISVYAFGTGGKRKKIFQDIYFSIEDVDGIGVLYTKTGEYSAIIKIENPVQKYSANIDSYYEFTHLLTSIAQTLGEGYAIHKQVPFRKLFPILYRSYLYRQSYISDYHPGEQKEPSFVL